MSSKSSLKDAILALLPPTLATELKESVDATIQSQFEQMDLVSRSEFDIQKKVLTKTRAKLEALEKIVSDLEKQPQD